MGDARGGGKKVLGGRFRECEDEDLILRSGILSYLGKRGSKVAAA